MTIYKFTFSPETGTAFNRTTGPEQVLMTGTLDECRDAWRSTIKGHHGDPDKCPCIGLIAKKGHVHALAVGGKGVYHISWAPELAENAAYEVQAAASDRKAWTPAGDTIEEAEALMRHMGEGPGRLLILRNRENGAMAVYEANSLGYLDYKGTYEQFYGPPR